MTDGITTVHLRAGEAHEFRGPQAEVVRAVNVGVFFHEEKGFVVAIPMDVIEMIEWSADD